MGFSGILEVSQLFWWFSWGARVPPSLKLTRSSSRSRSKLRKRAPVNDAQNYFTSILLHNLDIL